MTAILPCSYRKGRIVIYHKHHIIPKHAGGTDDPSNIMELSPEQHTEAHRLLYEQHGRWQDKLAWQALSGQIGKQDIIRQAVSHANKGQQRWLGKHHSIETKNKMMGHASWNKGKTGVYSHDSILKMSLSKMGIPKSIETKMKFSSAKKRVVVCPHCQTQGSGPMYRWHFDNCRSKAVI